MSTSHSIALGAMMTATSVTIQYISSLTTTPLGGIALAGLCPLLVVLVVDLRSAYLCWGGSSILSMLLIPNKTLSLLYAICFGIYPILKGQIEKREKLWMEWPLKLLFANLLFLFSFHSFRILLPALPPLPKAAITILLNLIFIAYDFGLSNLIAHFNKKFKKII
ncbi:MAG: hypothetical protein R3Y07_09205 [Eubacteriales bacterium]